MASLARVSMPKAGQTALCVLFLGLGWAPVIYDLATGDTQDVSWARALLWFAVLAFLVWRVWRGGTISWFLLLAWSVLDIALLLVGSAWPWDSWLAWNLVPGIAQLAIVILLLPGRAAVATGTDADVSGSHGDETI